MSEAEATRMRLLDPQARLVHRDVALLLGARFASDPLYPWAQKAFDGLGDDGDKIAPPSTRVLKMEKAGTSAQRTV